MMKITNRTSHFVTVSSILLNSCCFYINPAHSLKCSRRVNLREKFDFYSSNNKCQGELDFNNILRATSSSTGFFSFFFLEKIPLHLQGHLGETLFWTNTHSCTNSRIRTMLPPTGLICKVEILYSVSWTENSLGLAQLYPCINILV